MTFSLSIDVEDWFHTANCAGVITRPMWNDCVPRVERTTRRLLEIFDAAGAKGTFFVLGWVAQKYPHLVTEIARAGHEIASHGTWHEMIYSITPEVFREDIRTSKRLLEEIAGAPVRGYRAPNFSITDWAIDVLREEGFVYDSSVFPTMGHDRYGRLTQHRVANIAFYDIAPGLTEFPMSCAHLAGRNLPWAGGGYFRAMPYALFKRGVDRTLAEQGAFTFYLHPWEIDQPFDDGGLLSGVQKIRQSLHVGSTVEKLKSLVKDFECTPLNARLAK